MNESSYVTFSNTRVTRRRVITWLNRTISKHKLQTSDMQLCKYDLRHVQTFSVCSFILLPFYSERNCLDMHYHGDEAWRSKLFRDVKLSIFFPQRTIWLLLLHSKSREKCSSLRSSTLFWRNSINPAKRVRIVLDSELLAYSIGFLAIRSMVRNLNKYWQKKCYFLHKIFRCRSILKHQTFASVAV